MGLLIKYSSPSPALEAPGAATLLSVAGPGVVVTVASGEARGTVASEVAAVMSLAAMVAAEAGGGDTVAVAAAKAPTSEVPAVVEPPLTWVVEGGDAVVVVAAEAPLAASEVTAPTVVLGGGNKVAVVVTLAPSVGKVNVAATLVGANGGRGPRMRLTYSSNSSSSDWL